MDPAVGSGAFPLGMLNEIVKARNTLTSYMAIDLNSYDRFELYNDRNPYRIKRETIRDCIFACDIEPSAVDITKLRLWLSLVIDDQIMFEDNERFGYSTKPRELPNLDCNILCGNSLLDEFMGQQLITKNDMLNNISYGYQGTFYDTQVYQTVNDIIELQNKLYDEKDHAEKESLKQQIQEKYDEIILEQLKGIDKAADNYYEAMQQSSRPFILWQLYFPRVFRDNGGFDIVIGNPPYVDSEEMTRSMPEMRETYSKIFECAKGNWDLYILFWEKGFSLLNCYGSACLITPNKWLSIKYGEKLRQYLIDNIFNISDYSNFHAFESADVSTVVVMAKKVKTDYVRVVEFNQKYEINKSTIVLKTPLKDYDNLSLCLSNNFPTLMKIIQNDKLGDNYNIRGAATVSETYEIAKIVDDVNDINNEEYFKFINTGTIEKFSTLWGKQVMTYVKEKYLCPVIPKQEFKRLFPRRYEQACSEKLITTGIRYFKVFGDFKGDYCAAKSTEVITAKNNASLKILLPILNSSVVFFFLKEAYGGMAMDGGITFSPNNLCNIPIPKVNIESQRQLLNFADKYTESFTDNDQDELDFYIYRLYNLNEQDINIIEKFKNDNKRKR